jgi:hypothetical protein
MHKGQFPILKCAHFRAQKTITKIFRTVNMVALLNMKKNRRIKGNNQKGLNFDDWREIHINAVFSRRYSGTD